MRLGDATSATLPAITYTKVTESSCQHSEAAFFEESEPEVVGSASNRSVSLQWIHQRKRTKWVSRYADPVAISHRRVAISPGQFLSVTTSMSLSTIDAAPTFLTCSVGTPPFELCCLLEQRDDFRRRRFEPLACASSGFDGPSTRLMLEVLTARALCSRHSQVCPRVYLAPNPQRRQALRCSVCAGQA